MFKKREKIVYPRHGAGKVIDKFETQINGEKRKYYKLEFFDSPVDISIPIEDAEELGLRSPTSKYSLRKALRSLGTRVKIIDKLMRDLDNIYIEKIKSGDIDDAIYVVNLLRSLSAKKEKESKNFSYTASQRLDTALEFIRSEVALVLGKGAVKRYDLSTE